MIIPNNISFRKVKMSPEKTKQLYDKYPLIFAQKDLDMRQTAMCWGFECSDGWYDIIDCLCADIQNHIENKNYSIEYKKKRGELPPDAPNFPQIEATQVKEKFGGLRFYTNYHDEYVSGLIAMAESISLRICEDCGKPGKPNEDASWITTLCQSCKEDQDARMRKIEEQAKERLTVKMKDVTVAP